MSALYNENDPYAARWLANLVAAGHIAPGVVSAKSIVELEGRELAGVRQAHFFAGIGVWSAALRAAGWPDDWPVWTGSCPCQPFSGAGKGGGFDDKRHLWPAWFRHIREHGPDVIFGEQVEGPAGRAWLDLVFSDLEGIGYAVGAVVFPAAGVGAPHGRHRTYWVADAQSVRPFQRGIRDRQSPSGQGTGEDAERRPEVERHDRASGDGGIGELADAGRERWQHLGHDMGGAARAGEGQAQQRQRLRPDDRAGGDARGLAHAVQPRRTEWGTVAGDRSVARSGGDAGGLADAGERRGRRGEIDAPKSGRDVLCDSSEAGGPSAVNGFWRDPDWIFCRDNKWRPIEPGAFPLAHGAPARVGRLRAYGNAIVLAQAQAFIEAFLEVKGLSL